MKDGDKIVAEWMKIVKTRDRLKALAFSLGLAQVQGWLYWKDYKYANRN